MIVYLLVIRPYVEWQLQWMEVLAHILESGIIICAMVLISDVQNMPVTWLMVGECGSCHVVIHSTLGCYTSTI